MFSHRHSQLHLQGQITGFVTRFFTVVRGCVLALLWLGIWVLAPAAIAQRLEIAPKAAASNYALTPGDIIDVQVFREPELSVKQKISLEGTIKYPLIGIVKIAGLSADQAAASIAAMLDKDYVVRPQVSVLVTGYSKQQFTVLGQVMKPGSYNLPEEQTIDLLEAIAMAGGLTAKGNPSRVRVTRGVGETKQTIRVNVNQMIRESKTDRFLIQPNDIIMVEDAFDR